MLPQLPPPASNQFPVQRKRKAVRWALYWKDQEVIKGDYPLCNWRKSQLLKEGNNKNLLTIKAVEFIYV